MRHLINVAGEEGFEPSLTDSESAVLPLDYSPYTKIIAIYTRCVKIVLINAFLIIYPGSSGSVSVVVYRVARIDSFLW